MRNLCALAFGLLVALASAGCGRKVAPSPSGQGASADAGGGVAGPFAHSARRLPFTIENVYHTHKPSGAAPWHEPGGSWTFFDAKLADGARFSFGFDDARPLDAGNVTVDALLTTPDRDDGGMLAASFARTFKGRVPSAKAPQPLAPPRIKALFLGTNLSPDGSGFSGTGGGYYVTTLFLHAVRSEGQVFFSFDLALKRGVFAEKVDDRWNASALSAFVANELRDGRRPKRTSATDASFSETGPRIEWSRELPGSAYGMSSDGLRYWVTERVAEGGERLLALGFANEGDRVELLRVPHHLLASRCGGDLCVAIDAQYGSTADAASKKEIVFLFDAKAGTAKEVHGPWGDETSLGHVSPRADFFTVTARVPDPSQKRPESSFKTLLYVVDRSGVVNGPVDLGSGGWGVDSTGAAGTASRIIAHRFSPSGLPPSSYPYVAIDPTTLVVTPTSGPKARRSGVEPSPDGKHEVECLPSVIVVRDLVARTERRFPIHEDDRAALEQGRVSWVSNRYLAYPAEVYGFIDIETMKLSEAFANDDGWGVDVLEFDATFTHVVDRHDYKGTSRLGRIVSPLGP